MLREKNSKGQNNQDLNTRDSEIQTENVKLTQKERSDLLSKRKKGLTVKEISEIDLTRGTKATSGNLSEVFKKRLAYTVDKPGENKIWSVKYFPEFEVQGYEPLEAV